MQAGRDLEIEVAKALEWNVEPRRPIYWVGNSSIYLKTAIISFEYPRNTQFTKQ